jgi:hypothetical protein
LGIVRTPRHIGHRYKFDIIGSQGQHLPLKSDPLAFAAEIRPSTASIVFDEAKLPRPRPAPADVNALSAPMSIYEVHLGSRRRKGNNEWLTYRDHVTELFGQQREVRFFGYQSRSHALPLMQLTYKIEADDRDQAVRPRTKAIRVSASWRQDANTSSCALVEDYERILIAQLVKAQTLQAIQRRFEIVHAGCRPLVVVANAMAAIVTWIGAQGAERTGSLSVFKLKPTGPKHVCGIVRQSS